MDQEVFDCGIIGGGVGGLALSILLARSGKKVVLFEKERYPFHKVCGEYISSESLPFLWSLGVDLLQEDLPAIGNLLLSSPSGITVKRRLAIGGTGLSRYALDARLAGIARAAGVVVMEGTKADQVHFRDDVFCITAGGKQYLSRTAAGAYGKHSNIDVQLERNYRAGGRRTHFIAVKHHIRCDYAQDTVELHNFPGGYCGMSAIEDGKVNMSYIVRAEQLKQHRSIPAMERAVLSRNPHLRRYFSEAGFLFEKPLTISHLYFGLKTAVTDGLLMLGDAAGNIAPLSGNGMSMSMESAVLAFRSLDAFLQGNLDRRQMEAAYTRAHHRAFRTRITVARQIHRFFGHPGLTDLGFRLFRLFPGLVDMSGELIHGKTFGV